MTVEHTHHEIGDTSKQIICHSQQWHTLTELHMKILDHVMPREKRGGYMSVYLMLLASSCLLCKPRYVVNDGGKVGWSPQLNRLESSVVGLDHSGYTSTAGVLGVPVQSKLMRHLRRTEIHNHACIGIVVCVGLYVPGLQSWLQIREMETACH